MTSMYTNNTSVQIVGSSITTWCYSNKHKAHVRNLKLHYHSDKADRTQYT